MQEGTTPIAGNGWARFWWVGGTLETGALCWLVGRVFEYGIGPDGRLECIVPSQRGVETRRPGRPH